MVLALVPFVPVSVSDWLLKEEDWNWSVKVSPD